jgi:ABC-2 type transport system permease protein
MSKVWLILRKELGEIFQQRPLIYSLCVVPLIIVILAGIVLYSTQTSLLKVPPNAQIDVTSAIKNAQVNVGTLFRMYFLIEPLFIPAMIAAYSIVGEKNSHTLEPLLATPLETWQLLMAKSLSAMLPAIAATWISGGIFAAELAIFTMPGVIGQVITPAYLILLLLAAPVLTLTPVALTVMASSRFNEPRAAAQISTVIFVVLLLIFSRVGFGQVISPLDSYLAAIIMLVVGIGLFWIATGIFQRESILTRWK